MSRIVLGLGNTVDYELQWDSGVLERLILEYGIRSDEIRDFDSVHSEREMILSVLHFFRDSTGGRAFCGGSFCNPAVCRTIPDENRSGRNSRQGGAGNGEGGMQRFFTPDRDGRVGTASAAGRMRVCMQCGTERFWKNGWTSCWI